MKKLFLSLVLVFTFVLGSFPVAGPVRAAAGTAGEPSYSPASTAEQEIEEIRRVVYKYSPNSVYILESQAGTSKDVTALISKWYRGGGILGGVFGTLGTTVHEEYHGFQFRGYQLVNGAAVSISRSGNRMVKTEAAASRIPVDLRTFRWDTYVSPGNRNSSNVQGAYGLLIELSAYYYGGMAVEDCAGYVVRYFDKNGHTTSALELASSYFNSFWNNELAFHEFMYWTLEYLLYLKDNDPELYQSYMNNESYRNTFTYFYESFNIFINDTHPKNTKLIFEKMKSLNISVRDSETTLWFGNNGIVKKSTDLNKIKNVISTAKYVHMLNELLTTSGYPVTPQTPDIPEIPELPEEPEIPRHLITMTLNGQPVYSEVPPFISNDRTMVPVRFITEAFGAKVGWDDRTKRITITADNGTIIKLAVGDKNMIVEKQGKTETIVMDTPACIMDGYTFVSVRPIAEALGLYVRWHAFDYIVIFGTPVTY